jgi:hypothetical protein
MWVLFLDLIKAFNIVSQELMFQILAKFGIPESMIYIVRQLYGNIKIEISVGSEKGGVKAHSWYQAR